MVSWIGSVLAYVALPAVNIPLEVKEPIEVVSYPSQFSLYPGETVEFNVTVINHASLNYSVILSFRLNDSNYQTRYVTFSSQIYTVISGEQDLGAWLKIVPDAPATNSIVAVDIVRTTWYGASWSYRKSHVITSAAGAGTDYKVMITVHYGIGTDGGGDVYTFGHCKTDFGDIRFTRSDGSTLLDYWMESSKNSDNAVFWVEVTDDLSLSDSTLYVYYGNNRATTTSNGTSTFMLFDDFLGHSLDSKWLGNGASVSNSILNLSGANHFAKTNAYYYYGAGTAVRALVKHQAKSPWSGQTDVGYGCDLEGSGYTAEIFQYYQSGTELYGYCNGTDGAKSSTILGQSADYTVNQIMWAGNSLVKFQVGSNSPVSVTTNIYTSILPVELFSRWPHDSISCDWILVRKYVDPEPEHSICGLEQAGV
jgi:hypothetical protein